MLTWCEFCILFDGKKQITKTPRVILVYRLLAYTNMSKQARSSCFGYICSPYASRKPHLRMILFSKLLYQLLILTFISCRYNSTRCAAAKNNNNNNIKNNRLALITGSSSIFHSTREIIQFCGCSRGDRGRKRRKGGPSANRAWGGGGISGGAGCRSADARTASPNVAGDERLRWVRPGKTRRGDLSSQ